MQIGGGGYVQSDYPDESNGSGPAFQHLLEMMETQAKRIDEVLKNQQEVKVCYDCKVLVSARLEPTFRLIKQHYARNLAV